MHLEGILAALRALNYGDKRIAAERLLEIHGIIARNKLSLKATDLQKMLDDPKELERLNKTILEIIRSA